MGNFVAPMVGGGNGDSVAQSFRVISASEQKDKYANDLRKKEEECKGYWEEYYQLDIIKHEDRKNTLTNIILRAEDEKQILIGRIGELDDAISQNIMGKNCTLKEVLLDLQQ